MLIPIRADRLQVAYNKRAKNSNPDWPDDYSRELFALSRVSDTDFVFVDHTDPILADLSPWTETDDIVKDATDWAPILGGPGSKQAPFIEPDRVEIKVDPDFAVRFRDDEGGGP